MRNRLAMIGYRLVRIGQNRRVATITCGCRLIIDRPKFIRFVSTAIVDQRPPISSERTSMDKIFAYLDDRQSFTGSQDDLINAPDLAVNSGRTLTFVKVINRWFDRTKSIFDRMDYFNAAVILWRLGRLNRDSRDEVLKQFGSWEPVIYFARRMIDFGFHRFTAQEIVRSLSGLHHLAAGRKVKIRAEKEFKSILDQWILELEKYILDKSHADPDHQTLVRRAPVILFFLANLSEKRPSDDSLRRLCQLSKANFDRRLGYGCTDYVDSGDSLQCHYFVDAFLRWMIDPEIFAVGIWNSWYDLCADTMMARQMGHPIDTDGVDSGPCRRWNQPEFTTRGELNRFLLGWSSRSVSAAVRFDGRAFESFQRIWDQWKLFTRQLLRNFTSKESIDVRSMIPTFVFVIGQLAEKLRRDQNERRKELRLFLPLLENAMIQIGLQCDRALLGRAMTGFRDITNACELESFELSDRYFSMIRDWCLDYRLDNKNRIKASDTTALCLFMLRDMRLSTPPPEFVLEELCRLFRFGLDHVQDGDLSRSLCYFADACLNFNYDPTRQSGDNSLNDLWEKYFEKAKRHLEFNWTSMSGFEKVHSAYMLGLIANITTQFDRIDEFRTLMPVYENRLKEIWTSIHPKKASMLSKALLFLMRKYSLNFDIDLCKLLKNAC